MRYRQIPLLLCVLLALSLTLTACGRRAAQTFDDTPTLDNAPPLSDDTSPDNTPLSDATPPDNTPLSDNTPPAEDAAPSDDTPAVDDAPLSDATPVDDTPTGDDAPSDNAPPYIPGAAIDKRDFVRVQDLLPDVRVDLKYAASDNFTGEVIYDFTDAYLRYGTVVKLQSARDALREYGYGLLIWDAFRPVAAQFKLWEVYPDSTYVANPNRGFSSHSRGNTVDVTLYALDGADPVMPTGFDDFSSRADRDYSDCTREAAEHAELLETCMTDAGFKPYFGEWWHFSDTEAYDVEQRTLDELLTASD